MNSKKTFLLRSILLFSDFVILNLTYAGTLLLPDFFNERSLYDSLLCIGLLNCCWLLWSALFRLYRYRMLQHIETIYSSTWRTVAAQVTVTIIVYYCLPAFSAMLLLVSIGSLLVLFVQNRLLLTYITEFLFKKVVTRQKVLVVGNNEAGQQLATYFANNGQFYSLAGIFHNQHTQGETHYRGRVESCVDFAALHQVKYIYSTVLPKEDAQVLALQEQAENKCIRMLFVAKEHAAEGNKFYRVQSIERMPVLSLRAEPLLRQKNIVLKRVFDVVVSSLVILFLLSWLTPVLALLIRLGSAGPVFFVQERSGKDNQPFRCFKFRSMRVNAHSNQRQAAKGDSRITAIGAFMRKTSLDELPQFFNVWMGTMSVVGPRPHMLKHTEEYSTIINKYLVRQYLQPGITGWAQVNGYRGETAQVYLMEKRVEHDLAYMESWSLMLDIKIVFMTIINMLRGEENAR